MSVKEFHYTICAVGNASFISANRDGFLHKAFGELDVTPVLLQSLPKDKWLAHFDHNDPALFREGGNVPPIWAKSGGAEVVLIALIPHTHVQRSYVLARTDSPVDSVDELRGKRLALPTRAEYPAVDFHKSDAEHIFNIALAARGLTPAEVEFVEFPASEAYIAYAADKSSNFGKIEVEALDAGKADAIVGSGVRAQKLLASGKYKVLYELGVQNDLIAPISGSYPHTLTVSRRLAEDAPEIVVTFIEQLFLAAEWAKTNLPGVLELFSKQLHGTTGEVQAAFPRGFHKHLAPEFSKEGLLALEAQKRFLYDHGYIEKDFSIEKWADDSFLKTALANVKQGKDA
ncbi:MAG TPA: hypothetical protein VN381_02605 [Anaerovoracaceae bacterium]|nr:hypothetical protein [Anaerovoracaceae bacterium]